MHDSSLLLLVQKVRSWISWGNSDWSSVSRGFEIMDNNCNICCHCKSNLSNSYIKYECQNCGRLMCGNCIQALPSFDEVESTHLKGIDGAMFNIKSCRFCFELGSVSKRGSRCSVKIYPSEFPSLSPGASSPIFSGERSGHSLHEWTSSRDASFMNHPLPESVHCSPSRSDEDEEEDSSCHFFGAPSDNLQDASDADSCSVSTRHDFCSSISVGSSPSYSPSRLHITSTRVGKYVQVEHRGNQWSQSNSSFEQEQVVLERPDKGIWVVENANDLSINQHKHENFLKPLDIETNGLIWFPPPPDDVDDEVEENVFTYDDDDVEDPTFVFGPTDVGSTFFAKEKLHLDCKERWKALVDGHFRALVSQLLEGQGILDTKDNPTDSWLDIVTSIAWQTAKFIKPDRSRGGSMDPCDYVKVKCVASGSRSESKLIKGVVCTKNIKHKRMMTQYENAKLLLLGGALEYQRVPNKLASFETLLQQENDQLKAIVSKIVAHRPNVLLVEKSVSSFALEHLLAKEVSLVLNIKRPLLERIARCTGASITPTTDHISAARLGHCELFHVEKISEDHEAVNQFNKKPSKSFMFFEGCPWRLGCTVVLRGSCREELKKIKHVVQYAVFAAYHLLLETSFLADEGASLPQLTAKPSCVIPKKPELDKVDYVIPDSEGMTSCKEDFNDSKINMGPADLPLELGLQESLPDFGDTGCEDVSIPDEFRYRDVLHEACDKNLAMDLMTIDKKHIFTESLSPGEEQSGEVVDIAPLVKVDEVEATSEYTSANDGHQSILVYFSSHCMMNGTVCERSRLLRIKFYGLSDKPLGRYLSDDLFNQSHRCRSCKESAEAHVMCYTHRHASLTVNVRCLPSVKLPGELNGKIWMWHRCLPCARLGIPQTTRRVAMSNAAWGISFGKFLELSFSNHATGNRVASCGHSMQRDCLRFYGLGSMVAFFHYSPINILSVHLPPSILEFSSPGEQSWIASEAYELFRKVETLHSEISHFLEEFKLKSSTSMDEFSDASALHNHVLELLEMISEERNYYKDLLHNGAEKESPELDCTALDILEINRLRHALLVSSRAWDRCLYSLESLFQKISSPKPLNNAADPYPKSCSLDLGCMSGWPSSVDFSSNAMTAENDECNSSIFEPDSHENYALSVSMWEKGDGVANNKESAGNVASLRHCSSAASILSDKIDSAWSGANQAPAEAHLTDSPKKDVLGTIPFEQTNNRESPSFKRLWGPTRVYSFDSAQMLRERITKGLSPHFSTMRSFHASGDYRYMIRDPVINVQRTYSLSNASSSAPPTFLSSVSLLPDGARLMVLRNDTVVTVYDDEPTSVISCALSSKEYEDWVTDSPYEPERGRNIRLHRKTNSLASNLSTSMSFGSMDFDSIRYGSSSSEDTFPTDQNNSPHLRISFEDDSSNATGKVKFSVTCYFAKQFDSLQRRCCPRIGDLVRSLSRCRRWSAEGGKSNVYFAKSFDDRFIIKQVTKTERDSFEVFAPEYFKYLTNALRSGSPTCLAKIVGMYQVNVKHMKGGREVKMDLMVMENLFFKRNLSKVFDLKGSGRSRYNPDVEGGNKVLLDSNLLETVRTNPIFLGSKAKRRLERAIWNDTSFLASVDVMDYSLLVGVDEESKELVVGIIDFMRQYTWDKQLETWVKASGLLGGPKNAAPTIVSPIQYKKRFRKAMTAYFLTVPDK